MNRKKTNKHPQSVIKKVPPATNTDNHIKYFGALGIILILSYIIYSPVLLNGFLWDDDIYVTNNPLIRSLDIGNIFSQRVGGNYLPFTILTLATEHHFWGLNPAGYHAVNLVLHLLNVTLVFFTIFKLVNKPDVALVAALLFGVHPLHVESVAWVAELKDLLYTFFFLSSYLFYIAYIKHPKSQYYLLAILMFVFSLLSKAMAVSLPVLFVLTDYFKGRKIDRKVLLEKLPFLLLAIVFGIIAIYAQKSSDAIQDMAFSLPQRMVLACYSYLTYLSRLILPIHLCAFYPYPMNAGEAVPVEYYGYVLLLGIFLYLLYRYRSRSALIFGIGFFTVTVFLVLQLLPVGGAIMADRYSYVPSIGIFYLAGEGFRFLWSKNLKMLSIALLTIFTLFFSITTYNRSKVWNNRMDFWNDMISQYQTISDAYYNRGVVFMEGNKNDEALSDFNKTIALKPDFIQAYNNRGILLMNKNKNAEALSDFNKVTELNPDFYLAHHNIGVILYNEKRYDESIVKYSMAIKLKSDYADAYYNRGLAEYYAGKKDDACRDVKKAAEIGYKVPAEALQLICQ